MKALVDQAASEIAEQVATNVLIIEDEPMIAARHRADLVTGLGHDVCDIAAHPQRGGRRVARKHKPGLVLADIQLADGSSGIDAVNEILQSFDVPVIFITAYPGAPADRRAAGADLPRHQAVPHRDGAGGDQPGAVLRLRGAPAGRAGRFGLTR